MTFLAWGDVSSGPVAVDLAGVRTKVSSTVLQHKLHSRAHYKTREASQCLVSSQKSMCHSCSNLRCQ